MPPKDSVLPYEKFSKKKKCKEECKPKCRKKSWAEKKVDALIRLFNNEIPPK